MRNLQKHIERICRKVALKVVRKQQEAAAAAGELTTASGTEAGTEAEAEAEAGAVAEAVGEAVAEAVAEGGTDVASPIAEAIAAAEQIAAAEAEASSDLKAAISADEINRVIQSAGVGAPRRSEEISAISEAISAATSEVEGASEAEIAAEMAEIEPVVVGKEHLADYVGKPAFQAWTCHPATTARPPCNPRAQPAAPRAHPAAPRAQPCTLHISLNARLLPLTRTSDSTRPTRRAWSRAWRGPRWAARCSTWRCSPSAPPRPRRRRDGSASLGQQPLRAA